LGASTRVATLTSVTTGALDDIDAAIIEELYAAPRIAFREIARRVDVSEATVRSRVRRLEEAGVLRFTAFVDPSGFGRGVLGVALVDVEAARHAEVVAALSEWPEVVYLSTLLGEHSLQLQFSAGNEGELWRLVQATRTLPGVVAIHPQVEVEIHKIRYVPPGRST
jgi:Lrp/AsnC family transcriptional regulator for asnA, asnC and gidA